MTGATRYLIYGVTGSGKTTLARQVAERTGLPFHAVDDLTWRANWTPVPAEEQRCIVQQICAGEEWVLDSAYASWLDVPLARAQVVVALDYPRWLSLWRVTLRSFRRAFDQQPICGGNVETWGRVFSRDSMVVWHFRSFARKRDRIRTWASSTGGPTIVRLRTRRQAREWLDSLRPAL